MVGLADRGVRSLIVRIPPIVHSTTDNAGFLPLLIGLAKEKGVFGYPGDGTNLWPAVHARDLATLFRLAQEKGAAGKAWHAVGHEGIPFREIAEAIGRRLNLPVVPIPADVLMLPGYFGFLANLARWMSRRPISSRARPSAGNPPSPACWPTWTTAITSLPSNPA